MKLSILIPTIKEREQQFKKLYNRLQRLVSHYEDIEIVYNDAPRYDEPNGLTVGEKRQSLVDAAYGKYILFVDDDDDVMDWIIKELYPLLDKDVDVINANVDAYIDGKLHVIDQSIYNNIEQLSLGVTKRKPLLMSVYNRESLIKSGAKFPSINNGEDAEWAKQMNLKTEIKVNSVWHVYKFSSTNTVASKATRRCIVTFSNTERYNILAERLRESVKPYGIDFIHYKSFEEIGCKSHDEYPYAFKPYSIQRAREQGYNSILWLDSAIHLTKSPEDVFKYIESNGVMLFDNLGWSMGSYTSDKCLPHFGISREYSFDIKMVMACAMGFNFNTKIGTETFDTYLGFAHTECYQGAWNNDSRSVSIDERVKGHRHDQSVISCIVFKKELILLHPNQTFIAYYGNEGMLPHAESVCLISQG